jgi:erythromycin esterase
MAANVEWVLSQTDAKQMALWGHNEHVLKGQSNYTETYQPMGHHLAETFGDEYYALGFAFSHGSFQALSYDAGDSHPTLQECTVDPLHEAWPPEALDPETDDWLPVEPTEPALTDVLAASSDTTFLDIETAATEPPLQSWLSSPHLLYSIGSIFVDGPRTVTPYCVPAEMDGLLFVPETTRAVSLE